MWIAALGCALALIAGEARAAPLRVIPPGKEAKITEFVRGGLGRAGLSAPRYNVAVDRDRIVVDLEDPAVGPLKLSIVGPGGEPGERIEFWYKDDITIHLSRKTGAITTWRLEFGPRTTDKAGLFELNDTIRTPIRLPDIALWVDASLHALIVEDYPTHVVLKAEAQGDIGGVKVVEVKVIQKDGVAPRRPG